MRSIHNSLLFLVCHEVDELKVEFNWKRYVPVSKVTVRCSHSVSLHLRRVRVFNHLVCLILCQICLEVSNHHPPHPSPPHTITHTLSHYHPTPRSPHIITPLTPFAPLAPLAPFTPLTPLAPLTPLIPSPTPSHTESHGAGVGHYQ